MPSIDLSRTAPAAGETPDLNKLAEYYAAIITEIGGDLNSEGMRDTPKRAAKAIVEMTEGARIGTEKLLTMFRTECRQAVCHDMVIVDGMSRRFDFDRATLRRAINATFARRQTKLPLWPEPVSDALANDATKQAQWAAFLRRNGLSGGETLRRRGGRVARVPRARGSS